jgi:hypothetical protein
MNPNYTDIDTTYPNTINVKVAMYISNEGRQKYHDKMGDLGQNIESVKEKLMKALNQRADSDTSNKFSRFNFDIAVSTEMPNGINLNQCGLSLGDIEHHLNDAQAQDTDRHILLVYNCSSEPYEEHFIQRNLDYPLFTVDSKILCKTRNATFVDPEVPKFELVMANFLLKAAGCPFDNAVTITSEDGGDSGVMINYFIAKDSYEGIFKTSCGAFYQYN